MREILIFLLLQTALGQEDFLPQVYCETVWREVSIGDFIPADAVASHEGKIYLARAELLNVENEYLIGYYNPSEITAEFFYKLEDTCKPVIITGMTSFQILTNPNDCELSWSQQLTPLTVPVSPSQSSRIAKTPGESFWYPGKLFDNQTIFQYVSEGQVKTSEYYTLLQSSSQTVNLLIEDFQFQMGTLNPNVEVVGVDHFSNQAETILTQRVKHSRRITETLEFPINTTLTKVSKFASEVTKKVGLPSIIGKKTTVELQQSMSMGVEEEHIRIVETELHIEKVVVIPPGQSVTVCSTVDIQDNLEIPYTARGTYIARGISARHLHDLLKDEGIDVSMSDEGTVVTDIAGVFKGALTFSTHFYAIDGIVNGCGE